MDVTVLMSTYNGEQYISEQIESILKQNKVNIKLIIRDDGSTDATVKILKKYEKDNNNIIVIEGDNKGVKGSFFYLMKKYIDDEYIALADQDDIWDEDKIIVAIRKMQKAKVRKPLLYYSNLRIVNQDGCFCRNSHLVPHITNNKYASLTENLATGCTIVYNRALAEYMSYVKSNGYYLHDSCCYTICSFFGKIIYDFEPHISYRQHANNVVGTSKNKVTIKKIVQQIKGIVLAHNEWSASAVSFYNDFKEKLTDEDKQIIYDFISYRYKLLNRLKIVFTKKYNTNSIYRNLYWKIKMLLGRL